MTEQHFAEFIQAFNQGNYIAGVLPLEEIWFQQRDDFHKALIRLCVALNQLRLGLLTSPRVLLASAVELLAPYQPAHAGLDVAALIAFIERCRALIPADLETGGGRVPQEQIPSYRLRLAE